MILHNLRLHSVEEGVSVVSRAIRERGEMDFRYDDLEPL